MSLNRSDFGINRMKAPTSVDYVKEARKMPSKIKVEHLLSLPEVDLYEELKSLFEKMDDKDRVEITAGNDEYGRDLVIEHENPWGKTYIGVVVKKGDAKGKITGKSAKVVDEIIMQTREALSIPCHLREISVASSCRKRNPFKPNETKCRIA
jgi:hypothetical protein